jgi:hypothetical protein
LQFAILQRIHAAVANACRERTIRKRKLEPIGNDRPPDRRISGPTVPDDGRIAIHRGYVETDAAEQWTDAEQQHAPIDARERCFTPAATSACRVL